MPKHLHAILIAGVVAMLWVDASHAQPAAPRTEPAVPQTAAQAPRDIDPTSGNRLPAPTSDGMGDADKKIFDAATRGRPASVRFYSPKLAQLLDDAQNYLKSETGFGDQLTEIAVLVTSREMDSQFLWTVWEKHGRDPKDSRHIDPDIIDVIKYNKPVAGLREKDALFITFGRELFGQKKVSSETFDHAVRLLGRRGAVDLVELLSVWSATCAELRAYDQQLPAGQAPLLPAR